MRMTWWDRRALDELTRVRLEEFVEAGTGSEAPHARLAIMHTREDTAKIASLLSSLNRQVARACVLLILLNVLIAVCLVAMAGWT
jgi:hypothetical protein